MSTPETFSAEPRAAETAKIVALPSAQPGAAAAQPVSPDEESVAGGTAVLDDDVYGFQEKPFHVTPDARMVYAHRRYEEALSALNYSVMKGKGFAVITGEVGTGKTTLLRHYVSMLDSSVRYAVIFNTWLGGAELLAAIADDLCIDAPALAEKPLNRKALLDAINDFLIREFEAQHAVVVFIDEAQNLSIEALESLRMLSNLETETEKLIQIVLLGQPELQDLLARDELWQLRSRIAVAYHLSPMDAEETAAYVTHRITMARPRKPVSFSRQAFKILHRYSGGCPRIINIICDQCLVAGSELRAEVIDRDIMESVIAGFEHLDRPGRGRYDLPTVLVAMAVVVLLGALVGAAITSWGRDARRDERLMSRALPVNPVPAATAEKPAAQMIMPPPAAPAVTEPIPSAAPAVAPSPTVLSPLRALVASHSVPAPEGFDRMALPAVASVTGLVHTELRLNAATIEALRLPAILMPGNPVLLNDAAAIISKSEGGTWTVETIDHGSTSIPAPAFAVPVSFLAPARPWMKRTLYWRNYGPEITEVQKVLVKSGILAGEPTNRFDRRTIDAVKKLQEKYKLPVDGVIGPATAMALFAEEQRAEGR